MSSLTLDKPSYLFRGVVGNINIRIALLFFPLIGFLADVCFTRYRMIQSSFAILSTTLILYSVVEVIVYFVFGVILHENISKQGPITYIICVVIIIFGIGLFDANAI